MLTSGSGVACLRYQQFHGGEEEKRAMQKLTKLCLLGIFMCAASALAHTCSMMMVLQWATNGPCTIGNDTFTFISFQNFSSLPNGGNVPLEGDIIFKPTSDRIRTPVRCRPSGMATGSFSRSRRLSTRILGNKPMSN